MVVMHPPLPVTDRLRSCEEGTYRISCNMEESNSHAWRHIRTATRKKACNGGTTCSSTVHRGKDLLDYASKIHALSSPYRSDLSLYNDSSSTACFAAFHLLSPRGRHCTMRVCIVHSDREKRRTTDRFRNKESSVLVRIYPSNDFIAALVRLTRGCHGETFAPALPMSAWLWFGSFDFS